jgi:hypothetical protein
MSSEGCDKICADKQDLLHFQSAPFLVAGSYGEIVYAPPQDKAEILDLLAKPTGAPLTPPQLHAARSARQ